MRNRSILGNVVLSGMLGVLLLAAPAWANIAFHVSVDTNGLVGSSSAPFTIDFQLNDGGVPNNNSASIAAITFGGGAATGAPTLSGGATGSLTTGVSLADSSPFNEFDQTFTPGSTLGFDVNLTTNVDAGPTPDQFSFAILDKNQAELGTTDPSSANTIVTVNLDSANPTIQHYASNPPTFGAVTITPIPEPATVSLMVMSGLVLAFRRRPRRLA